MCRAFDLTPASAFGIGLPSASMVMPLILPASAALTPVAKTPLMSFAVPMVYLVYYYAVTISYRTRGNVKGTVPTGDMERTWGRTFFGVAYIFARFSLLF